MKKISPLLIAGGTFLVGLLIGWTVLGWMVWPVHWINTDPWDLRLEHQERYVELVAEEYEQSHDVVKARASLAGWDREALAALISEAQQTDPEAKERLEALAKAVKLTPLPAAGAGTGKSVSGKFPRVSSIVLMGFALVVLSSITASILFFLVRRPRGEGGETTVGMDAGAPSPVSSAFQEEGGGQAELPAFPPASSSAPGNKGASLPSVRGTIQGGGTVLQKLAAATAEEPEEPGIEEEVELEEGLWDVFKSERAEGADFKVLSGQLEDIDIIDLLEQCKEVASKLG